MKLFVTGGAGFIGSNFITYVLSLQQGYRVLNYDKLTYAGNLANLAAVEHSPDYSFVKGDICDTASVETAMRGCDAVVHFAAETHVDRSIYEPAPVIQTNITGTFILLQVARKLSVRRFVHISTDEVYGDLDPGAFADEDSPVRPSSPYAASKAASDLLVRSYVRTYGFPAVITRSSNNYGAFQFPEKFLPLMISVTPWTPKPCRSTETESKSATGSTWKITAGPSCPFSRRDDWERCTTSEATTSKET